MKCFQLGVLLLLMSNLDQFELAEYAFKNDSITVPGDLMIVALFAVHRNGSTDGMCGTLQETAGLQRVETALRKIEDVNKQRIACNLGIHIVDTCESTKSSYYQRLTIDWSKVIGVMGPATSEETSVMSNIPLPLCSYLRVGYGATSSKLLPELETSYQPTRTSNMVRVVPSDEEQVRVIKSIVQSLSGVAVNVIGSPDKYGQDGVKEFNSQSSNSDVCVYESFTGNADMESTDFVKFLNSTANVTQILAGFCDSDTVRNVLIAARELNMTQKFVLIFADRWAERDDVLKGLEKEAEKNIFINIRPQTPVPEIHNYSHLRAISKNFPINEWMKDFEDRNNCSMTDVSKSCKGVDFQDKKLAFVSESMDTFVRLVDTYYTKETGSCSLKEKPKSGICYPGQMGSPWMQMNNDPVLSKFESDGNPRYKSYEIFNYRNENGVFRWVSVGNYNGSLSFDKEKARLPNITEFNSHCRLNCTPGYQIDNSTCCWNCTMCKFNNFTLTGSEHWCTPCHISKMAFSNKTGCEPKNEERIYWYEIDALICLTVSTFGILATLLSAYILHKNPEEPIVKYSSPELLCFIFCGMMLAYCYAFLLVFMPSRPLCTVMKVWSGISLTMIYAPLLVRINRTSRAFTVTKLREPYLKQEYFRPRFLVKFVGFFLILELIMIIIVDAGVFLYHDPLNWNPEFIAKIDIFCRKDETNQFNSRHLVNVLLLVYCCVYAYKTIKLPDNFFESKFVLTSCGTTVIIWLIYLPIFAASQMRVVQISLSLVLSSSAFLCLAGLILPKVYVILEHPQSYKTYVSMENKVQQENSEIDAMVTMDISLWEYLGVASRITPDFIDESVLKSASGATSICETALDGSIGVSTKDDSVVKSSDGGSVIYESKLKNSSDVSAD